MNFTYCRELPEIISKFDINIAPIEEQFLMKQKVRINELKHFKLKYQQ